MSKAPSYSENVGGEEVSFYPCGAKEVSLLQLAILAAKIWPDRSSDELVVRPGLNCFHFGPAKNHLTETPVPDAAA